MEKTPVYLICVTPDNHNKVYSMTPSGNDNFIAEWGRVGGHMSSKVYPMSKWDSQINSKLKKGYVSQTHLMTEVIENAKEEVVDSGKDKFSVIENKSIRDIIKRLYDFANKVVQSAYKVKSSVVTQAMIDEAQALIDNLAIDYQKMDYNEFNKKLLEIFVVIPRKMGNVGDYLIYKNDMDSFKAIIEREQSTLDAMAGQVYKPVKIEKKVETENVESSILDEMGITMEDVDDKEIIKIKKMLGKDSDRFIKAWRVNNQETDEKFKKFCTDYKIDNTKLMWHGSRSENFFNILKTGLKIRPANAVYTGSMFSDGLYFSTLAHKSIGYTSTSGSYWAHGNARSGFMAIFEVAYGNPYTVYEHTSECYHFNFDVLQKKNPPCHCVYASPEKGMLRNPEIIFYRPDQVTVRYLVEIK